MAVHKVPQDVEADDKFLGPLSFKQFIFFGGAMVCGYLTFIMISRGLWPVSILFGIPAIVSAVFAFPWSKDQPTDVWLAARIRFYLVPHKRIWNQDGIKDLVTVTAPLRQKAVYSDGLSQTEVRSRFGALASMVDSRGWAVKGGAASNSFAATPNDSDRLTAGTTTTPVIQAEDSVDPLDETSSPIARQFDSMIQQSQQEHRSAAMDLVAQARTAQQRVEAGQAQNSTNQAQQGDGRAAKSKDEEFWFLNQQQGQDDPSLARFDRQPIMTPGMRPASTQAADDAGVDDSQIKAYVQQQKQRQQMQGHVRHEKVINPASQQEIRQQSTPNTPRQEVPQAQPQNPTPTPKDPAILELAQNNDLSIETLQRQGHRPKDSDGEVTIDLR